MFSLNFPSQSRLDTAVLAWGVVARIDTKTGAYAYKNNKENNAPKLVHIKYENWGEVTIFSICVRSRLRPARKSFCTVFRPIIWRVSWDVRYAQYIPTCQINYPW